MNKNKFKFIFALTIVSTIVGTSTNKLYCDSITDKKNKVDEIQQQINNNNNQIAESQKEAESYINEIKDLDSQISQYTDEVSSLNQKVDEVNSKITNYEDALQNSSQRYSSAEDMYTTRVRAIYESGVPSILDILLSSDGIDDFFSKLNVYQSILEYDKSLVGNIKSEKEYIDYIKKDIENQKVQLDQLKYDVEKSTNSLNSAKAQKQAKVNELNASADKLAQVNELLNKEAENLNKKIQEEIAAAQRNNTGSSNIVSSNGRFDWPLKVKGTITATFPRYSDGTRHDGVDIAVPVGTPVYAAASGKVITSKYYIQADRGGGYKDGYGNYVMIYHSDYTTLYGHLKFKQVVSVGQMVNKGDLIGYTASTGNSTGPHLHFEVRKGTTAVNPMQFFN